MKNRLRSFLFVTTLTLPGAALAQASSAPAELRLKTALAEPQKPKDLKPGPEQTKKSEPAAPTPQERAIRGVVLLQRGRQQVALGTVLAGDGRILTALSPLGNGNDLEARFPDGSLVRVKLGHHDRAWDLALLVPQTGKWRHGLVASSRDPVSPEVSAQSFTIIKGKPSPTPMVLRSHRTLIGGDQAPLDNAIELGSRVAPADLGAPIVDSEGRVVALLGRGCLPGDGKPCAPVAFGVPMSAIRAFLRSVPASAVAPSAWLGIQGASEEGAFAKGVRILTVHPGSPAEEGRLRGGDDAAGDVILAIDGVPVTTPEALAEAIRSHGIGESVPIILFGGGRYRTVNVALRAAPDPSSAASLPPSPSKASPAELPPTKKP